MTNYVCYGFRRNITNKQTNNDANSSISNNGLCTCSLYTYNGINQ